MTRTVQHITAYEWPAAFICSECGSVMLMKAVQNGAFTRARCMSRGCLNRNLAGETPNRKVELLVVEETIGEQLEETIPNLEGQIGRRLE